ncbi:hypothetical protein [Kistimonas asteriae]|uniref:hypothetical protein n=1 Tax=Kistimonas asteriae TaxID=517724 RepID=UPI001BAD98F6|nr:hypothetical protein [Kistimonas asteriae]
MMQSQVVFESDLITVYHAPVYEGVRFPVRINDTRNTDNTIAWLTSGAGRRTDTSGNTLAQVGEGIAPELEVEKGNYILVCDQSGDYFCCHLKQGAMTGKAFHEINPGQSVTIDCGKTVLFKGAVDVAGQSFSSTQVFTLSQPRTFTATEKAYLVCFEIA